MRWNADGIGVATIGAGLTRSYSGLLVCRFLVGCFEAGLIPCSYLLGNRGKILILGSLFISYEPVL
jgi:hypothetical protein